jgi:hypothetical protein
VSELGDGEWMVAAVHESGHVAARIRLGPDWRFRDVRNYEDNGVAVGKVRLRIGRPCDPLQFAAIALAGGVAESRYTGVDLGELVLTHCRTDFAAARDAMKLADRSDAESLDRLVAFLWKWAANDWPYIERIAGALVERRELDYDEVLQLVR